MNKHELAEKYAAREDLHVSDGEYTDQTVKNAYIAGYEAAEHSSGLRIVDGKLECTDDDLKALEKEGFRVYYCTTSIVIEVRNSYNELWVKTPTSRVFLQEEPTELTSVIELDTQEKLDTALNYMRLFL